MKPWHAVIGLTLAVTTITALPVMAGAVEAESCDTAVSQLAYRSLDSAQSFQEMEAIVAARNSIIFGDQAWTVDGAVYKFNVDTGEVEALPDFYDLFPADWTVPVTGTQIASMPVVCASPSATASSNNSVHYRTTRMIPSETESGWTTAPFYEFQVDEEDRDVGVTVTTFAPDRNALYNAGFVDAGGESLGWVPGLLVKEEGASISGLQMNRSYGVVVSMVKEGGSGQILVDYTDLISTDFVPVG